MMVSDYNENDKLSIRFYKLHESILNIYYLGFT